MRTKQTSKEAMQKNVPVPGDVPDSVADSNLKKAKEEEMIKISAFKSNFYQTDADSITHKFLNFLLYKTLKKEFSYENFTINNVFAFSDSFVSNHIDKIYESSLETEIPSNKILIYQGFFEQNAIDIILDFYIDSYGKRCYTYKVRIYSNEEKLDKKYTKLINFLRVEIFQRCPWKNKIVKINTDENESDSDEVEHLLKYVKTVDKKELNALKLEKIYIPEFIKSEIKRFCFSIEKGIAPLRFIFSGEPGTAKTEILKYISNELSGKCTIILVNSGEDRLNSIFNLSNYLSPCLICIDDIDFIARDGESYFNSKTLASFIQKLDGFLDLESVSILATTNDKRLIDIAAKRPGRFDQIIDVNEIDSKNYIDLIKDQLEDDEQLLEYFTDNIISDFKKKKVTGSFIVNLIKQLKIYIKTIDIIDKEYIEKFIKNSYLGFYDSQIEEEIKKFGFIEEN